ncbi:MAG: Periplasmic sensor signal transduction histidine kinase precursor [Candidatus Binatus sp.]|nr:Periplasmic sensor signal transduction histidine kinase precursor [Candidatus Binatus sp.]
MKFALPALNLKAKLIDLMVVLIGITLGAEVWVSLGTQEAIVATTQEKVKDLARVIQISVQELTSVGDTDRDRLHTYVSSLHTKGLEVSIASSQSLIINSSNPELIGAALRPKQAEWLTPEQLKHPSALVTIPPGKLGPMAPQTTVYLIPVEVEDHLLGYVQVVANFADFAAPLAQNRSRQLMIAFAIFSLGLVFAYILADRYVKPIHAVANAAQNIAARGLEPVPEAHRRDEIGLLTRSFNDMVGQLRGVREREHELNRLERFTALGQLAGGLAHEIKNPLNFISLALDQLRARYAPQQPKDREAFLRQLGIMKDELRRLSEMVQSFLHYGRPIEIYRAPTDVYALVDGVIALSESKMKSQGIELVEEGKNGAGVLNVDAEKIRTCFINVVANAIQAMPEGGTMHIGFRSDNGNMVIRFSDTGEGIEADVADHVFEPFFTTKREGIGLGLFLSKAIVEAHGGTIGIGANPDRHGTTVTFTFPTFAVHQQS